MVSSHIPVIIDDWLSYKLASEGRAKSTAAKYRANIARLSEFLAHNHQTDLLSASKSQLEAFTGLHLHEEGISPRSRRAIVAAVKEFYRWAKEKSLVNSNPASELVYPKAGRRLPTAMTLGSAEKLIMQPDISTFIGLRDATMIAIMVGCGVRVSGLVSLNEGHLQWFTYKGLDRLAIQVTEKGGRQRLVPVPYEATILLMAYLGHDELQAVDRLLEDGDKVLFISSRNRSIPAHEYRGEHRRLRRGSCWRIIQAYADQVGIPMDQAHPHAARHLLGTELAEDDIPLLQMQALFGHADPKTTEIYTHLAMGKLTSAIDKANPLGKMRTPVSHLVDEMKAQGLLS
ncbi:tyrosine-type recombinase/integrase [Dasania sp. GY-MA-18]|uniref:Tyrosine-type recombinase/integrase n=1 Tax=Dasania phycosphaerae TaxID=2950436 RepID=A0A9J6RKA1_9GAMM|nr:MULTISPECIES: tyrosine-type recombinase/integrase [Dasania]MCR8922696.1 tyrosine-type recombinase/integrase [Dasania sp. GY-MA-18]MCZ0865126.1 tyrosine-type recombinase/integrase [Dasania phycosphaerae]MCZ0868852.1 tyrosine-type recombinase/integrase [Dasania phycosphaerae]